MRPIWSGMITFGLVNIPVKLYVATNERGLDFDYLRRGDHCQIRYARVCRKTGEEVPYNDIVKGYEYQDGDYVVLEKEDFENANVKQTQTIDVMEFIDEKEIDLKYIEKPYYIEPEKKVKKAYMLLRDAMQRAKKVGVVKFIIRTRQHLGILKSEDNGMILIQMRFADEIRDISDLDLPEAGKASAQELNLALELISKQSGRFHPEKFKDTYTENLKKLIEQKAHGRRPPARKGRPARPTPLPDLLSRLKASLEATHHN